MATLLPKLDRRYFDPAVAVLSLYHPMSERLKSEKIKVIFFEKRKWDPSALLSLVLFGYRFRPDLLHLNGMKAHFIGRIAGQMLRVPTVIHLHYKYKPRPAFVHKALSRSTAMALSISKTLYDHAQKAFHLPAEKVCLLYNPINVGRFSNPNPKKGLRLRHELGINTDTPVIALIGRVITKPDKGHRMMIRAMTKVISKHAQALLIVVGDGSALPECKRLAQDLGVSKNICFIGQRDDVPDILSMVNIVVTPSENEEVFPYVVIEAMCSGRPVVGSRIGGITEQLGDGKRGLLVDPGDSIGFAEAICKLLDDPNLVDKFVMFGKEYASKFTIARHVKALIEVYRNILTPLSGNWRKYGNLNLPE